MNMIQREVKDPCTIDNQRKFGGKKTHSENQQLPVKLSNRHK